MHRFRRVTCGGIFFITLILFEFLGCSNQIEEKESKEVSSQPVRGGIYRMPLLSNPPTLDPANVKDKYGETVVHQIFDGLVRFDSYLTVLPGLAETWQVEAEGRIYRFVLRENARFHNGEPVTPADVIFSISRLLRMEPPPVVLPHLMKIQGAEEYRDGKSEQVSGLEIASENELRVRLKEPHVPFLTALGMYQASIVPKQAVESLKDQFGRQPVGSGPFSFVEWQTDDVIRLERFQGYYGGPAYLDGIRFDIYPGGQDPAVLAAFQKGKIEEMEVYSDIREKLADRPDLQWFHRPSLSLFFYGMNCSHPHLANADFRKALSMAIDRKTFVEKGYNGQFDVARTILPPGMPGYSPVNPLPDNDIEKAVQYLEKAFGSDPGTIPEIEIVSAFKTPRVEQEMEMITGFWAAAGIKARVRYITDWTDFEAYLKSDKVQLYRYAWFADMPDPDSILQPLFAQDSPNNFMKFRDGDVDQMLREARGVVDPVERANLYQKIESRVMASLPLIPLFYMSVDRVYQPNVKSVKVSALGAHTMPLNRIWLDPAVRTE